MEEIIKCENDDDGTFYKNKNGEYHNINDEPAAIFKDGGKHWCKNNVLHRTKGPAIINKHINLWFYMGADVTKKVNQLMEEGRLNPDWRNWTEEDEFLFVLLIS